MSNLSDWWWTQRNSCLRPWTLIGYLDWVVWMIESSFIGVFFQWEFSFIHSSTCAEIRKIIFHYLEKKIGFFFGFFLVFLFLLLMFFFRWEFCFLHSSTCAEIRKNIFHYLEGFFCVKMLIFDLLSMFMNYLLLSTLFRCLIWIWLIFNIVDLFWFYSFDFCLIWFEFDFFIKHTYVFECCIWNWLINFIINFNFININ